MIYGRKLMLAASACAAALLSDASAATAQDQPPPPTPAGQTQAPPPAPSDQKDKTPEKPADKGSTTVQGVTVTGERGGFKSAIDRKSYDLTKDLQTQAGAPIGDALRNLPGVNVDVQGNVSIRGDSNVVILVDGKPSSLFSGPGRAQVLESLPADQYERAEVLTNPSTEFSPNGSAGIINLISKKSHGAASSGSVRAMEGTNDHWRLGASANYVSGPISLTLNAGEAYNLLRGGRTDTREGFDSSGAPTFSSFDAENLRNVQVFGFASAGLDDDLDDKTRLSLGLHSFHGSQAGDGPSPISEDNGAGVPVLIDDRVEHNTFPVADEEADLSWRRTFDGDQHDLTLSVSSNRLTISALDNYADVNVLPALPDSFEAILFDSVAVNNTVKADYERPMPKGGQLKAGYELDDENDRYNNTGFQSAPTPTGPLDPAETDLFHFDRAIQAIYTTYQQPFGKFTVLGGLRYETNRIDLDQETQHITGSRVEARLYPSLHVSYQIDDTQQLTASYSRRIERPDAQNFNPFRGVLGPLSLSQGNPALLPQQTQDYELGYQYKQGQSYYLATLYYKDNREGVTPVEQDIGNGVILTTQENLASSRSGGLELVASGKLFKTITYSLSADGAWNQIDATPLGFPNRETGYSLSGNGTIAWQATPGDLIQANGFIVGKRLTAQGYQQPGGVLFLGYRHKFDPHLSLFVTGIDVMNTMRFHTVLDTPTLREDIALQFRQRALLVGLTYSFGGATKRDPQFDFGAGGGPH